MEPDAAYIPGHQRLKITDVQYVDRSVLADIDDCIFGVGMKYDMVCNASSGDWSRAVAMQFTTSFEVAFCGRLQERQKEEYWKCVLTP